MKARRAPEDVRPAVATPDWPVAALAAVGFVLAAYLTFTKLRGSTALFCEAGSGCDVVQASRYAMFLGLPTAAWGAVVFILLGAVAVAGLTPRRWLWAFVLAVAAVAFSAYLTAISLVVLGATCPWCLAVAVTGVAILGVLLMRRPVTKGKRAPTRPGRLAWIGALAAVVTVVGAQAVFVMDTASGDAGYREALARHLQATGIVMYGAYW
jgi:uncharacterized membrane protein